MLLASCSTPQKILVKNKYVKVFPPESLIQECQEPNWFGGNNGDLADFILSLQSSIEQCNNDKKLLREFNYERSPDKN